MWQWIPGNVSILCYSIYCPILLKWHSISKQLHDLKFLRVLLTNTEYYRLPKNVILTCQRTIHLSFQKCVHQLDRLPLVNTLLLYFNISLSRKVFNMYIKFSNNIRNVYSLNINYRTSLPASFSYTKKTALLFFDLEIVSQR